LQYNIINKEIYKGKERKKKMIFYIEVNSTKEIAIALEEKVENFIISNGSEITKNVDESDIILSLGGDGTLLRTWRKYKKNDKPIFGINCGTLGYLTEGTIDNWEYKLKNIIEENYKVIERMTIKGQTFSHICNQKYDYNVTMSALNDIVITKPNNNVIDFEIYVNDKYLTSMKADGIICSTPTGATGYALSAGGSFIDPYSEMIELIAIAPHTLLNRSIMLSKDSLIKIKIVSEKAIVSYDGCDHINFSDKQIELEKEDYILITSNKNYMKMAVVDDESFIDTISKTFTK
jgi:NAD+ kinase